MKDRGRLWPLLVICILLFLFDCRLMQGQSVNARPVTFAEHVQHTQYVILPYGGGTSVASGEQTSGFRTPIGDQVSLGEFARQYRAEHKSAPKSVLCWEGDGPCTSKTYCPSH